MNGYKQINGEKLKNAYIDAPELHRNLLLASLQLLVWLFFHPSAWRSHIVRIDPTLSPNFTLARLTPEQWRRPELRRILLIGYLIWPLLVGLLVGLVLLGLGGSGENILFGVAGGVTYGLIVAAVASGVLEGVALTLTASFAIGVVSGVTAIATVNLASHTLVVTAAILTLIGLLFGLVGGMASAIGRSLISKTQNISLARQLGGITVGILVGGGTFLAGSVTIFSLAGGLLNNLALGTIVGLSTGLVIGWCRGFKIGLTIGLVDGVMINLAFILAAGLNSAVALNVAFGILFVASMALPYLLAERIAGPLSGRTAGPLAGAVAATLGTGGGFITFVFLSNSIPLWPYLLFSLLGILVGLLLTWQGPVVLYPALAAWSLLLLRIDERRTDQRPSLLRWNSAFWDEHQRLPLLGLADHLLLVAERNLTEGQVAIDYLSTSHQRWAAQTVQIELDAHELESCTRVDAIGQVHVGLHAGELAGPASSLLRSFSRLSHDVMTALQQESAYNQRLTLSAVEDRLDGLLRELTRSSERYAVRFRPIAAQWRQIVANHRQELAVAVEQRQEIDNPYIIGVPLTEQQEIFVGRTDISAHIEQLLLDRRRPPLLLYGQRRMGKTSLLNNLGRLLPSTIVPLFVDLQGPASRANNHAGFLYNIARGMNESARRQRGLSLPGLPREALADDPFTRFDEWLDEVEQGLGEQTILLALDEFEALDYAIVRGHFDPDAILGMLRHLIQHRPRFKVLLTGSHSIEEFQRWASYLINVQTVYIGYLQETEARQLIEQPVKGFALRYEAPASRRVLELTGNHPFLVQLLCGEIVALKNEQDPAARRLARLSDVEAAVPEAISRGSFFFSDIERNQIDSAGLALLRFLARQGEGATLDRGILVDHFPGELDQAIILLLRRELIELTESGYRFQVELVRRWFEQV